MKKRARFSRRLDLVRTSNRLAENLGYARVDISRYARQGFPEAVFCPGKTTEQIVHIFGTLARSGGPTLATRVTADAAHMITRRFPNAVYHPVARIVFLNPVRRVRRRPPVFVLAAGTADLPVAEEAAVVAEVLGKKVERLFDVGVSGLHRLLAHEKKLRQARAVIVCAGMDGALPSVVGGLVSCPVIAVPTSIGYGTHLNGIASLLTMLNSCAANVSVVNIDNGFGAGVIASLMAQ